MFYVPNSYVELTAHVELILGKNSFEKNENKVLYCIVLYCIVLYCIMRPYTDGPIGSLSYRHSSGVVRNPHSALAE